jgi:hypothetical protein
MTMEKSFDISSPVSNERLAVLGMKEEGESSFDQLQKLNKSGCSQAEHKTFSETAQRFFAQSAKSFLEQAL